MHYRLKRLKNHFLRALYAIAIEIFLFAETISQIGFLRPWLLPERRKAPSHTIPDRRVMWFSPFGLALWLVAFYIVGVITWGDDPRYGVQLALAYGLLICTYIFMRWAGC